uniref:Uncharacterized protein n=1 Tax=Anopheles coluzzii TaxID=1518534 RepID=A0A8W7PE57_ANOCL
MWELSETRFGQMCFNPWLCLIGSFDSRNVSGQDAFSSQITRKNGSIHLAHGAISSHGSPETKVAVLLFRTGTSTSRLVTLICMYRPNHPITVTGLIFQSSALSMSSSSRSMSSSVHAPSVTCSAPSSGVVSPFANHSDSPTASSRSRSHGGLSTFEPKVAGLSSG